MSVVVPHKAIDAVSNATDPKQAILREIGSLAGVKLLFDEVLLGTYFRPRKTAGGIIRPDDNVGEDMWQGKVGLILKFGLTAYKDTPDFQFAEIPSIGDWAVYYIGDARQIQVNGFPCRIVRDSNIRMIVSDPNTIL